MRTEIGERLKRQGFRLDLHGAFIRRAELDRVDLQNANFAGADAKNASFRGSNFKGANLGGMDLEGADLRGADLTDAKHLTVEQLSRAVIGEHTKLPPDLAAELRARREPQASEA